jgi:hypothetical protein
LLRNEGRYALNGATGIFLYSFTEKYVFTLFQKSIIVQSVKIAVGEKFRRSKWPSVKIAVGQNCRRSKIPSVKTAVSQNCRQSKLPSVKIAVCQNGRRSKLRRLKDLEPFVHIFVNYQFE